MNPIIKLILKNFYYLATYLIALPFVVFIRLARPFCLIRIDGLISSRLGHFVANTELYLCEKDEGINVPPNPYVDIFYFADKVVCNVHLAKMWRRKLIIGPRWLLASIVRANKIFPGWQPHVVFTDRSGLDKNNLLDKTAAHLIFTEDEERLGECNLDAMEIPKHAKFVCLNVRDSAYLTANLPDQNWSGHDYRDNSIENYLLMADALAARGFFVIRMGAKVSKKLVSRNPKVIDYATNGMRSEFMDIFLASKCAFAVSTGSGWDSLPEVFRRPIVYTNFVPIGLMHTFRTDFLSITKRHFSSKLNRDLTFREMFSNNVAFATTSIDYARQGIELIENTADEIRDVVLEMADRTDGIWSEREEDHDLQSRFWHLFHELAVAPTQNPLAHGELRSRVGAEFLRNHQSWLA